MGIKGVVYGYRTVKAISTDIPNRIIPKVFSRIAEGMSPPGSWIWWSSEPPIRQGLLCSGIQGLPPHAKASALRLTSRREESAVDFFSAPVRYPLTPGCDALTGLSRVAV